MPVVQAFDVGQYGLCAAREGFELRGRERTVGAVPHGHHEHVHRVVGINGLQAEAYSRCTSSASATGSLTTTCMPQF